jgi:hypothetical protein
MERGRYLLIIKQTPETNICILSGIRTRDPRNQAASDQHLRPHDHRLQPEDLLALSKNSWVSHSFVLLG